MGIDLRELQILQCGRRLANRAVLLRKILIWQPILVFGHM